MTRTSKRHLQATLTEISRRLTIAKGVGHRSKDPRYNRGYQDAIALISQGLEAELHMEPTRKAHMSNFTTRVSGGTTYE